MPTTTRSSTEVIYGPGLLYAAPVGTTEPTSASATLSTVWREVGYTEDGSALDLNYTNEGIFVAEEFYFVKSAVTKIELALGFQMKQGSRRNLALAMNAGAAAANDGSFFEPPTPTTIVRIMLVLQTEEGARWVFRQCLQGTSVQIKRDKAPNVATMPVQFQLEKPTSLEPFIVFPTAAGLI